MAVNFPRLAICYGISGREQELPPRPSAHIAAPFSRGRPQETFTFRRVNARRLGRLLVNRIARHLHYQSVAVEYGGLPTCLGIVRFLLQQGAKSLIYMSCDAAKKNGQGANLSGVKGWDIWYRVCIFLLASHFNSIPNVYISFQNLCESYCVFTLYKCHNLQKSM